MASKAADAARRKGKENRMPEQAQRDNDEEERIKMKKTPWIIACVLSAAALVLQAVPTYSMLNLEGGPIWWIMTICFAATLMLSAAGLLMSRKGNQQINESFNLVCKIALFLPLGAILVRVGIAAVDILDKLGKADPDVFGNVNALRTLGFAAVLLIAIALPIAGWPRKNLHLTENDLYYTRDGKKLKKRMSNRTFRSILIPITAVLVLVAFVGTIAANMFAGYLDVTLGRGERQISTISGSENWNTAYYGEKLSPADAKANALQVLSEVTDEGMVLLKNNGLLPLAAQSKVTPFGKGYVFPFFDSPGDESSMKHSYDYSVYPKEALSARFTVLPYAADLQPATTDGVSTSNGSSTFSSYPDQPLAAPGTKSIEESNFGANARIPELSVASYDKLTEAQKQEMADSVGLVFISRTGSENADLKFDGYTDGTPHYLALSRNEKDMIAKAKELCGRVVVVINSINAMELAPLMEGELEADAIVLAGLPGETGFHSLAKILCGEVNPSGRTVDIYTRDNLANPVMANYGSYAYEGMTMLLFSYVLPASYVEYAEGMYMGYRYYETAHDIGAAGFTYGELDGKGAVKTPGEVTYPFGYGLSYTTYEQHIADFREEADRVFVDVQVTNTGDRAGKEVVQLYFTPPYTDYDREMGIEKPTATLCAFAKTQMLEPGASQTLTLEIAKDELTSFDAKHDNADGTRGCYLLEGGDYVLSLRKNSHDVLDQRTFQQADSVWYDNSNPRSYESAKQAAMDDAGNLQPYPESAAVNPDAQFIAATALFPYMDEYMAEESRPLTRANWDATVPVYTPRADYAVAPVKALSQKYQDMITERGNYDAATNKLIGSNPDSLVYTDKMPASAQQNGLSLSDMRGKDFYDPDWERLLDQIDWTADHDQVEEFLLSSNYYTPEITSIGLPSIIHTEGANGIRLAFAKEEQMKTVTWCMCPVMAATWNAELAERIGAAMAAEALANGTTARYSPAFNIHRSPFSGRNMEYYSEDPFLTGSIVSNLLNGSTNGGLIEYMKHFVLNDQETNRSAVYTWATEQTAREIYLKPFEMCIRLARKTVNYISDSQGTLSSKVMRGAGGMMYSMNSFGPVTSWANYDLTTRLVRQEWNFHGLTNTDWTYPMGENDYTDMVIFAGVDSWLTGNSKMTGGAGWMNFTIKDMDSATARTAYRNAIHHAAYQIANSNAMQGAAPGSIVTYATSPWVHWLTAADICVGVLALAAIAWIILRARKAKQHPEAFRTR